MRIRRGVAERLRHTIDQLLTDRMLELFGFLMHPVPRVAEELHQEELDDAVPPDQTDRLFLARFREPRTVIRDMLDQPLVGHLDDALLVELSWSSFSDETLDYGDYCRFRAAERPRGNPVERRLAWETACLAEVALLQQRRQVRDRRYVVAPVLPDRFRVG